MQDTWDSRFSHQSICSVFLLTPACAGPHIQRSSMVNTEHWHMPVWAVHSTFHFFVASNNLTHIQTHSHTSDSLTHIQTHSHMNNNHTPAQTFSHMSNNFTQIQTHSHTHTNIIYGSCVRTGKYDATAPQASATNRRLSTYLWLIWYTQHTVKHTTQPVCKVACTLTTASMK